MEKGYIHSIETMGLVDGPGIRVVVFMQGCPLRCAFCHNPDTWEVKKNLEISSKDLVDRIRKFRPYFEESGGVTFSGGEPLLQSKFLAETLRICKKAGIHTCIDTSGTGYDIRYLDEILKWTDLILLDIKAMNPKKYEDLVQYKMDQFNNFLKIIQDNNKELWIRQVMIPGINDNEEYVKELAQYIKKIKNVTKVELLPYNTLGVDKYKKLNIDYRLKGIEPLSNEKHRLLSEVLNNELKR